MRTLEMRPQGIHSFGINAAIEECDLLDSASASIGEGEFPNTEQSLAQLAS
jgi:hypothetical protein